MSFQDHQYQKPKSASKILVPAGQTLKKKIFKTTKLISEVVGATLGPNGRTILIERAEPGLAPGQTKDGVSVIRSFTMEDPVEQVILEVFRDMAVRTVTEAGDGTTTSVILGGAILEKLNQYLEKNPKVSAQYAARELNKYCSDTILPYINKSALKVKLDNYDNVLLKVAKVSTNGDSDLSEAVLEAFRLVGDSGHIHLVEEPGADGLEVSKTEGYAFDSGFEKSLGMFSNEFINDHDSNRIVMDNPHILLIDGKVLDLNPIIPFLSMLETEYQKGTISANIVIMAHGFSKETVANLAKFSKMANAIRVLPCITPADMLVNSQYEFLRDIAAFTGGTVFNSLNRPIHSASLQDLGKPAASFECQRYRSVVHGAGNEQTLLVRVKELKAQAKQPSATRLAVSILEERAGRLSGGIAKLTIRSVSEARGHETKDRADDAICGLRGALKSGVLPGGCRILLNLSLMAETSGSELVKQVLSPALREPLYRLLTNSGYSTTEISGIVSRLIESPDSVYDIVTETFGSPLELGVLDSAPAVLEAIRASVSVATLLSTLGGVVAFGRDKLLEASDAAAYYNTKRDLDAVEEEEME